MGRDDHAPALTPLGAHALSELRSVGWHLMKNAVSPGTIAAIASDLDALFDKTPFCEGGFYGERTKRLGRLLSRSRSIRLLVEHPDILAATESLLSPWCDTVQLNLTQAIEIHEGALPQLPHRDQDMWQGAKGEMEYLVNVMWPLTPFTEENGATLIYPDSHGARALCNDLAIEPLAVECTPGSAILFLGSTLHGAGGNRTPLPRRGIIVSYCLGWLKPYENQWLAYPPEIARQFGSSLAGLVGYRQHRPNLGNVDGLCPSLLLTGSMPANTGARDALRPDQEQLVAAYVAQQRDQRIAVEGAHR